MPGATQSVEREVRRKGVRIGAREESRGLQPTTLFTHIHTQAPYTHTHPLSNKRTVDFAVARSAWAALRASVVAARLSCSAVILACSAPCTPATVDASVAMKGRSE